MNNLNNLLVIPFALVSCATASSNALQEEYKTGRDRFRDVLVADGQSQRNYGTYAQWESARAAFLKWKSDFLKRYTKEGWLGFVDVTSKENKNIPPHCYSLLTEGKVNSK